MTEKHITKPTLLIGDSPEGHKVVFYHNPDAQITFRVAVRQEDFEKGGEIEDFDLSFSYPKERKRGVKDNLVLVDGWWGFYTKDNEGEEVFFQCYQENQDLDKLEL